MEINDVEKDFEPELLEVAEPDEDAEEQRDRNTHYLLTAWKELLESRRKKEKVAARAAST
ncbi:MAG: hypothetical protein ACJ76N_09455 [Thermoanaerobaculia bacterium]